MKTINIKKIIILAVVVIVVFAVIGHVAAARRTRDVEEGVAFLKERESGDVNAVRSEIEKIEQQQKTTTMNRVLEEIASGERDLWEQFGTIFLVGDSRMAPFLAQSFLTDKHIHAGENVNLRNAKDGLKRAEGLRPDAIVFGFGLDDALGLWVNKEEFIAQYEEVIRAYQNAIPEADIYLCSIAPVSEDMLELTPKLRNIPSYNSEISSLCSRGNYTRIDCEGLFTEHEDLYAQDGVHFNTEMYPVWGQMILEGILRSKNSTSTEAAGNT